MAPLIFKIALLTILGLIVLSLFFSMVCLIRDNSECKRTVTALTFRITLSIGLFILLLVGYFAGWIHPHGLDVIPPQ